MKKIIDGKMYNTETAVEVSYYSNGYAVNDFNHYDETLYKTKNGTYFLYGEGGAMSKYSVWTDNSGSGGSDLIPLTKEEAQAWIEQYSDIETYIKEFGEVEEA